MHNDWNLLCILSCMMYIVSKYVSFSAFTYFWSDNCELSTRPYKQRAIDTNKCTYILLYTQTAITTDKCTNLGVQLHDILCNWTSQTNKYIHRQLSTANRFLCSLYFLYFLDYMIQNSKCLYMYIVYCTYYIFHIYILNDWVTLHNQWQSSSLVFRYMLRSNH